MGKKIPTTINKFLGLNIDPQGDTQLKLGESSDMVNFQVTESYKLKKRIGYIELFPQIADKPIQGLWNGKIAETEYFIFACNGKAYKTLNGVNTEIGTLTDAKTFFFAFNDKLYILNGYEYKYWDGTTFADVTGYRPLIFIGTPPTGGGTAYEQLNVLTGAKRQRFSADNTSTAYNISESLIDSFDYVKVNGVTKTLTTDYTIDLVNGKVTFVTAPITGQDNVEIGWTKGTGQRDLVYKCRAALLYGGANDTRVFIWGNNDCKNRRFYSGLADGVPSVEYFPANYYSDVGSSQYAITDIVKQQDRQIIFKENSVYYSYLESVTLTDGTEETSFPVYPLNDVKGNKPFNQARIILNNPYSVYEGVYEFVSTNVRDERNATYKSARVQYDLDSIDLSACLTFDNELSGEYWLCYQNTAWIYNYRNDTWYKYILNDTPTSFIVIGKYMYFGTANGQIMKFDETRKTDNGTVVESYWEMGFYDFDIEYIIKYINKIWITLKPESKSSLTVEWESNKNSKIDGYLDFNNIDFNNFYLNGIYETIGYNLFDYESINYKRWTYNANRNPRPFRVKMKVKKFAFFKLLLKNQSEFTGSTILSIDFLTRFGSQAK
jgi:hypothetical protein